MTYQECENCSRSVLEGMQIGSVLGVVGSVLLIGYLCKDSIPISKAEKTMINITSNEPSIVRREKNGLVGITLKTKSNEEIFFIERNGEYYTPYQLKNIELDKTLQEYDSKRKQTIDEINQKYDSLAERLGEEK